MFNLVCHGLKIVLGYDKLKLRKLLRVFRAKFPCSVSLMLHCRLDTSNSVERLVFLDFKRQLSGRSDCVNIFYFLAFAIVLVTRALFVACKWIATFWGLGFNYINQRYEVRISDQLWLANVRDLMFLFLSMIRLRIALTIQLASLTRFITVVGSWVFIKTVNQTSIALFKMGSLQWRALSIFSQITIHWSTFIVDAA